MNRLNATIAGLAAGCLLSLATPAAAEASLEGAEVGHWTMDYDAATKLAAEKNLPMMLNFTGSDWCGWCKRMDKEVFAMDEWKEFAKENVVLVTLDYPRDKSIVPEKYVARNKELQEQFKVRGYPTYVIVDSDGKTRIGQLGAGRGKTPASFITEFKTAIRMSPKGIEQYAKANPDKADAYRKAVQEVKDSEQALNDWLATRPERNEENNQKFAAFKEHIEKAQAAFTQFE